MFYLWKKWIAEWRNIVLSVLGNTLLVHRGHLLAGPDCCLPRCVDHATRCLSRRSFTWPSLHNAVNFRHRSRFAVFNLWPTLFLQWTFCGIRAANPHAPCCRHQLQPAPLPTLGVPNSILGRNSTIETKYSLLYEEYKVCSVWILRLKGVLCHSEKRSCG